MVHAMKLIGLTILLSAAMACSQTPREPPESWTPRSGAKPASASSCDEQRVELLLSAPHDPPTKDQLVSACTDPSPLLSRLARDTSARGLLRLRAIESLGAMGGVGPVSVLSSLGTASGDLASVRRTALVSLAKATHAGDTERARVGVSALSDSDPHVRLAAARLLRGSASESVRAALEQAKAAETEAFVRDEIERVLSAD
jgi:HEAT repeat protein